ncbi:hypothetical protein ACHAWC_002186, partial [Mediolabrus comicus]
GSKNPPSSFGCDDIDRSSITAPQDETITSSTAASSGGWITIVTEEFKGDYGIFTADRSNRAVRYASAKGKAGVIRMSETSTLKSSEISIDKPNNKFRITLDLYSVGMSHEDSICVDYQMRNASINAQTTTGEKCWKALHDFPVSQWETKTFDFDAEEAESLRIRLRVDSTSDNTDTLISRVNIEGSSA